MSQKKSKKKKRKELKDRFVFFFQKKCLFSYFGFPIHFRGVFFAGPRFLKKNVAL
jgi:uncharacterized membrane protein